MKAVLFISHGSRLPQTKEEVRAFVGRLKKRSRVPIFEYAYLEITHPSIPEGIDICVKRGALEIIVLLNFLNTGKHVEKDIPRIIQKAREKYPDVVFHITDPVGQHARMTDLFLDMIEKSFSK